MALAGKVNERVGREELLTTLKDWGISTETLDHPEVLTVEEALPHVSHLEGIFAKNLFLRDKKKKLWLFCAPRDANVKLNDLARLVGAPGGLRFADESILQEKLGLKQGAVTLFGLINDKNHDVKLILDQRLLDGGYCQIYFHPMVNDASTGITSDGLKKFIENTGHEPILITIPDDTPA